jgi:hypothetical protein
MCPKIAVYSRTRVIANVVQARFAGVHVRLHGLRPANVWEDPEPVVLAAPAAGQLAMDADELPAGINFGMPAGINFGMPHPPFGHAAAFTGQGHVLGGGGSG